MQSGSERVRLSPGNPDQLWELFHENSKLSPFDNSLSEKKIRAGMNRLHECLSYQDLPTINLPRSREPLEITLGEALSSRRSVRHFRRHRLSLRTVGTILHYAYGRTDPSNDSRIRPPRIVPSGGALYPLEIYFYSGCIKGLDDGVYHFNPVEECVTRLKLLPDNKALVDAVVYHDTVREASMVLFLTAIFERSTFKYGDRGYRFTLLEAGHVAQNIQLTSCGLGLSSICLGGFFDRHIDKLLELDGITHSTVYALALGKEAKT